MRQILLAASLMAAAVPSAPAAAGPSFGEDRAEIENLMTRYLFALDGRDPETYAATFAPDGSVVFVRGEIKGREALAEMVRNLERIGGFTGEERSFPGSAKAPPVVRHMVTSTMIEVDGDKAKAYSYWFQISTVNYRRTPEVLGFGHYEDDLVRIDGAWRFQRRQVFNETLDSRRSKPDQYPFKQTPR
ncbi:MAG: nuclear transport factor 2 family protein [Sphingomonas sp.]